MYLGELVLLFGREINVSKKQDVVLRVAMIRRWVGNRGERVRTLYSNCSISLNSSSVNLPGWTPLTSRPKSLNFEEFAWEGGGGGELGWSLRWNRKEGARAHHLLAIVYKSDMLYTPTNNMFNTGGASGYNPGSLD